MIPSGRMDAHTKLVAVLCFVGWHRWAVVPWNECHDTMRRCQRCGLRQHYREYYPHVRGYWTKVR